MGRLGGFRGEESVEIGRFARDIAGRTVMSSVCSVYQVYAKMLQR